MAFSFDFFGTKYSKEKINDTFDLLISSEDNLSVFFDKHLSDEYSDCENERIPYLDIERIAEYIITSLRINRTDYLPDFFDKVEQILSDCDSYVAELIVIGFFESLQAYADQYNYGLNYFDKWLGVISKREWYRVNDYLTGKMKTK